MNLWQLTFSIYFDFPRCLLKINFPGDSQQWLICQVYALLIQLSVTLTGSHQRWALVIIGNLRLRGGRKSRCWHLIAVGLDASKRQLSQVPSSADLHVETRRPRLLAMQPPMTLSLFCLPRLSTFLPNSTSAGSSHAPRSLFCRLFMEIFVEDEAARLVSKEMRKWLHIVKYSMSHYARFSRLPLPLLICWRVPHIIARAISPQNQNSRSHSYSSTDRKHVGLYCQFDIHFA